MRHTVSLKQNHEFRSLYARGKNAAGVYLAIYARKNRLSVTRLGITVSAKLGNAVTRNRVKRRIREAYRLREERFATGFDVVLVARGRAVGADFAALGDELVRLGRKLGVSV
ncbi:MAG: ribonuclease P protein component [Oscillospiraceae bacterium]|jgi:ribonuclease P protein component|nr:ribonuclease P protein component [Oscillospiraceae bacterium]